MIIHRCTQIGGPARRSRPFFLVTRHREASLSRAARLIRTGQADHYYDAAVRAYRIIQDIENGFKR